MNPIDQAAGWGPLSTRDITPPAKPQITLGSPLSSAVQRRTRSGRGGFPRGVSATGSSVARVTVEP